MRIPDEPTDSPRATASIALRYEDVSQEGRLVLEAIPTALGETVWRRLLAQHPLAKGMRTTGVIPILSRVIALGGGGPIGVNRELTSEGTYEVGHNVGDDGKVARITLAMWCTLRGVVGRTHGPAPESAGQTIEVGRIFAEHVFTRPFGDPSARKVLTVDIDGVPSVPAPRHEARDTRAIIAMPEGARPLDAELVLDAAPIAFGLDHTDSNQHVNSLVYPRVFIEAALRRLHKIGGRARRPLQARGMEIAYRKPSFAGEQMRVAMRAYERDDRFGVVAVLISEEEALAPLSARPRVFVRLELGD